MKKPADNKEIICICNIGIYLQLNSLIMKMTLLRIKYLMGIHFSVNMSP